ncbi:MAG: L-serine ammonia-lyase, partial [Asticcacaulis sp. 32-58-5]
MCVRLCDDTGAVIFERTFYSVGGGFIASSEQLSRPPENDLIGIAGKGALPFASAAQLLEHCAQQGLNIYDVVLANEDAKRSRPETDAGLLRIWQAMDGAINRGLRIEGILPGGLSVRRRASSLYQTLTSESHNQESERLFDWLNVFAMAVNEENAAGGRVVTAPTNGAAGIIPALIRYYCAESGWTEEDTKADGKIGRFLLTAAGIGMIYKQRASLSGAEMGCQGEVGVACSMGAAGLCAVWGGTAAQIEHAAEIGMEHNLGLTCDPVGGLVQIPCIERNAIGAVKAANAARLSLRDLSEHKVTLDQVIETMRQTGLDMSSKYKETSQGGLAVNVVEC